MWLLLAGFYGNLFATSDREGWTVKNILCFGDSNTWGFMPHADRPPVKADNRYPFDVRWPGRLEGMLGKGWRVIEEGLNGRTTMFDCFMEENRNGLKAIDVCLLTAMPADLVILMLGTNDSKRAFDKPPFVIAHGVQRLILRISGGDYGYGPGGKVPEILVVSPIRMTEGVLTSWLSDEFDEASIARCNQLSGFIERVAAKSGARFLDAGATISADVSDGIHMNAEGHARMAELIYAKVREIFPE